MSEEFKCFMYTSGPLEYRCVLCHKTVDMTTCVCDDCLFAKRTWLDRLIEFFLGRLP